MTRYKFLKITLSMACILTVILSSALCVSAASDIKYTNKETGYKIVIKDEADLLTSDEENKLIEDMDRAIPII